MKVIDRAYVESNKEEILNAIKAGKIFIYPTDTIYGLGCVAREEAKIRDIKKRETKPFSVIAPNKDWIIENCEVEREILNKYLPGPYTLIARLKAGGTLGVRIPDHWLTPIIQESGELFITTSVNIAGEPHMERLEDVKPEVLDQVDYVIHEGEKKGQSSEKINLV